MFGRKRLQGVFTAVVTPFDSRQNLDLRWMERHLAFQRASGVDGIVICGTNGEGHSLSLTEKRRLIEFTRKHRGRLRLIVATGTSSLAECIELSHAARKAGAEALLVPPPFFDHTASEEGVIEYFRRVANSSAVPVILYNIPWRTGIPVTPSILRALKGHRRIIGVKDSSGDLEVTRELVTSFPRLQIFCGTDTQHLPALRLGCAGLISGVANVFPDAVVQVWKAHRERRGDAETRQEIVTALTRVFEGLPPRAATKYALELAGMPRTFVRPPAVELTDRQKDLLRSRLNP